MTWMAAGALFLILQSVSEYRCKLDVRLEGIPGCSAVLHRSRELRSKSSGT